MTQRISTDQDISVIVLPDGFKILVPPGEDPKVVLARHELTAISEGICPLHRTPLKAAHGEDPRPWCAQCGRWWWSDQSRGEWGWELMYDPHEGQWPW